MHEYFQTAHCQAIAESIAKQSPDVIVLQELYSDVDAALLSQSLPQYPYKQLINTWYHKHAIMVLSKFPISVLLTSHDKGTLLQIQ